MLPFLALVNYRFSAKTLDQNMYRHTINGYMSTITSRKTIMSKKCKKCESGTKTKIISSKFYLMIEKEDLRNNFVKMIVFYKIHNKYFIT